VRTRLTRSADQAYNIDPSHVNYSAVARVALKPLAERAGFIGDFEAARRRRRQAMVTEKPFQ